MKDWPRTTGKAGLANRLEDTERSLPKMHSDRPFKRRSVFKLCGRVVSAFKRDKLASATGDGGDVPRHGFRKALRNGPFEEIKVYLFTPVHRMSCHEN